ncbi:MAG: hypothetical protein RR929_00710 [Erysipelotrichaceae bacterium]
MSISNNIKFQFEIFRKSKHIYIFVMCAIGITLLYSYGQFKQLDANLKAYDHSLQLFEENGITEKEALTLEHKQQEIKSEDGSILTIDENPLMSAKIATTMTLYSISPYYFLQNILEGSTYLFFPLILSIYGIYMTSQEYENKVIRVRSLKNDWAKVMVSKILFGVIASVVFISVVSLLAYLISILQFNFIEKEILEKFFTEEYKITFNIFTSIGISMLVSIIFVSLSSMLVTIFKNKYSSLILTLLYLLAIPSLGIYDLKNILMNLTYTYFPYFGTSSLVHIKELPIVFCLISCLIIVIGTMSITYFTARRQNKYL